MPYITQKERDFIVKIKELGLFVAWLLTVPVQQRKGFVAFAVNYIAKYAFTENYFGMSTGIDAVRSALNEMIKQLDEYELEKRKENGDV